MVNLSSTIIEPDLDPEAELNGTAMVITEWGTLATLGLETNHLLMLPHWPLTVSFLFPTFNL